MGEVQKTVPVEVGSFVCIGDRHPGIHTYFNPRQSFPARVVTVSPDEGLHTLDFAYPHQIPSVTVPAQGGLGPGVSEFWGGTTHYKPRDTDPEPDIFVLVKGFRRPS